MAQLRPHANTIESLNATILVITFGAGQWARAWLEETQSPFPLLLDPEREAYEAFELERSFLRSWGLKNFWYYLKALWSGRRWRGIRGDSSQLGGDFIVDRHGIIRLAHPSRDPTDRLPVEQLLARLKELNRPL